MTFGALWEPEDTPPSCHTPLLAPGGPDRPCISQVPPGGEAPGQIESLWL